jgi:hypothetical protein
VSFSPLIFPPLSSILLLNSACENIPFQIKRFNFSMTLTLQTGVVTIFNRIKDDPAYKTTSPSQSSIFRKIPTLTLGFMSLIVCRFNILELHNHPS